MTEKESRYRMPRQTATNKKVLAQITVLHEKNWKILQAIQHFERDTLKEKKQNRKRAENKAPRYVHISAIQTANRYR